MSPPSDGGAQLSGHSSQTSTVGVPRQSAVEPETADVASEDPSLSAGTVHLLRVVVWGVARLVFSSGPFTDWVRPTRFREDNVLYSKPLDLNVNLIQKHPQDNTQSRVGPHLGTMVQPLPVTGVT